MKQMFLLSSILGALAASQGACSSDVGSDPLAPAADAGVVEVDATPEVPAQNWIRQFGDVDDSQTISRLTNDSEGHLIVSGEYEGDIDFGAGALTSGGRSSVFLAKLAASGEQVWSKTFGDFERQYSRAVITDADDNVILAGDFEGDMAFGTEELSALGSSDMFLAKFASDGTHLWSFQVGDSDRQYARSAAVDSAGNIIVVGDFFGAADFGGGEFSSLGGGDVFVAKYSPSGEHLWSKSFGDAVRQKGNAVAVDSDDNIVLTGEVVGTINFGGDDLTAGGSDVYLAKLGPDGSHKWSHLYGNDSIRQAGVVIAVDSQDNITIGANFEGGIDFGGGLLESAGSKDIGIAQFTSAGVHRWSKRYGDSLPAAVASLTIDPADNVHFTGQFRGEVSFGGEMLSSETHAAYLVSLDSAGEHKDTLHIVSGVMAPLAIAIDDWNQRVIGGKFWGDVSLEGQTLSSERGDYDAFLMVLP